MRNIIVPIVALATTYVGLYGQTSGMPEVSPQVTRLEPRVAKPGMVLTITGVALGKSEVGEVYLTDHRFDMKVKVLKQTDELLQIRVPPFVKAGRHQLLFLTTGQSPTYLEQPVYVLLEIEEEVAKSDSPKPQLPVASSKADNDRPDKQDK